MNQRNPYFDPPLPATFDPQDEAEINQTNLDLSDPQMTMRDVAEAHRTTLPALAAWLARPPIAQRMTEVESGLERERAELARELAALSAAKSSPAASVPRFLDTKA